MKVSQDSWISVEKEEVNLSKLICSIKCVENSDCGAILYNPDTGVCQIAKVCKLKIFIDI